MTLDTKKMVLKLQAQVDKAVAEKKSDALTDVNIFFGPSKEFARVFKMALCTNSMIKKPECKFNLHEEPIFA